MVRKLALGYAVVVAVVAVWAWVLEVAYLGSDQEHLVPPSALAVVSLPTSYFIRAICTQATEYCGQYGQLALVTAFAGAQAAVVVMAAHWLKGARTAAPHDAIEHAVDTPRR